MTGSGQPQARQNPFRALRPACGVCEAYGAPWGSACSHCGSSDGYPAAVARTAPTLHLSRGMFTRPPLEPPAPTPTHPKPERPATVARVDDPGVPRQARQIHAAAMKSPGWHVRVSHARGNDLDPKTGHVRKRVDSVMVKGERGPALFASVWITGEHYECLCGRTLKPIENGTFRRHGDCQGAGQKPTGPPIASWDLLCAYWRDESTPGAKLGFEALKSRIREAA